MSELCKLAVYEEFEVLSESVYGSRAEIVLGMPKRFSSVDEALTRIYPRVVEGGCYPLLRRDERGLVLHLFPKSGDSKIAWNIALALVTLVTVFVSGLSFGAPPTGKAPGFSWSPAAYMVGLLVPLMIHELGHWIVMRAYRTPSSLPYLIPAPPLQLGFLGTFGAVINLRWLPPSSEALSLMAIAGPLAGYVIAVPLAVYGIGESVVVSEEALVGVQVIPLNVVPVSMILVGQLLPRALNPSDILLLSPLAFASYVVFLVTFLNLMPIAMLDGGHIVRGIVGSKAHSLISRALIATLIMLALVNPVFLMFALIAIFIYFVSGGRHPGPAMSVEKASKLTLSVALTYGVLLVLTAPMPLL
ncbi:MAG: site-2 protease family protein [Thermoprotei archaeon]|nr:site-2 protease family protein [Thermoprotei archaeon]